MSFDLKLQRAREHLNSFEVEAGAWINAEPYGVVDEPDPEPPPYQISSVYRPRRFRVTRVSPVPERLSIIVGDCVFNLRSALDHLALSLAKAGNHGISDKQIRGSEFLICHDRATYTQNQARRLGCVAPGAAAIIEALQPYHRGSDYPADPLWKINELNRIDKHQSLAVCAALPMHNGRRVIKLEPDRFENFSGRDGQDIAYYTTEPLIEFKVNAIWFRWAGKPVDPNQDMSMNPTPAVEVVFGDGGPAAFEPVIPALNALCNFVGDVVIPQLSQFL